MSNYQISLFLLAAAIFEGRHICWTQFLKRANQGLLWTCLIKIDQVFSEEM